LLSAILSDFDLSDEASTKNARETLDILKSSAAEDDASDFDPSGTSAHFDNVSDHGGSMPGTCPSRSDGATDISSLSNGVRSIGLSDTSEEYSHNEELEKLDEATKEALLKEMFPTASSYTVSHTLKKCNGHWNRAMEELLNHMFFEGEEQVDGEARIFARGVDAFSEDNAARRARKGRKTKRNILSESDLRSSSSPPALRSTWDTARKDIEFISTRANVASQAIQSLYHSHNASLPATILALLDLPTPPPKLVPELTFTTASEDTIRTHAAALTSEFPSISPHLVTSLVRLTYPSTSSAHELAAAITASPRTSGIQLITHYAPISTSSDPSPNKNRHPTTTLPPGLSPAAAHSQYTAQASAAYRRARSDRLMSGAAAYYSQLGRDAALLRNNATSDSADALVASQSKPGVMCDLHGVSVKDAVRIARREAEGWWRSGGGRGVMGLDGRVRGGVSGSGEGFRIITGVGRHSEGGKGKLGPAVAKVLVSEGWRVIAEEGVLVVVGKSGRG